MEINIDLNLLKQELALYSGSIVIDLKSYSDEIVMDLLSVETIVNDIFSMVKIRPLEMDSRREIIRIRTIEDYLVFVAKNYIIDLRKDCSLVLNNDTELYIAIVYLTAYLSKISDNYFNLYEIFITNIPSMEPYYENTRRFVDSRDIRGLLFVTYKKYLSLDLYDKHFLFKSKAYLYSPPKVNRSWLQKHRKENEPVCFWFYESTHGAGIFIVLYGPKCRYRQCIGCSLHELSSEVGLSSQRALYSQLDYVIDESISWEEQKKITEVIISNNGNMLDHITMPTLSLLYIVDKCITSFPTLKKVVLESRLEYIDEARLSILQETRLSSKRDVEVEIAVGVEIFDDYYRNQFYKKGINLNSLEKKLELFSQYDLSFRVYMMFKACPDMNLEQAIEDINRASRYFAGAARERNLNITLHINPTFVSRGSQLEILYNQGHYQPPSLQDIAALLLELEVYDDLSYYISLNDEGLAASRLEDEFYEYVQLKNAVERFNIFRER